MAWRGTLTCAAGVALSVAASAEVVQNVAPPAALLEQHEPPSKAEAIRSVHIAANTPADIEIVDQLSSKTSHIDDMFAIRLVSPIVVDGRRVVPAGTPGMGQIVHSAKAGFGGKAGEIIVAARYLDLNGIHIPLRRFRVGGIGADRVHEALTVGMLFPIGAVLVSGGEKIIPAGMRANAIVATDIDVTLLE